MLLLRCQQLLPQFTQMHLLLSLYQSEGRVLQLLQLLFILPHLPAPLPLLPLQPLQVDLQLIMNA